MRCDDGTTATTQALRLQRHLLVADLSFISLRLAIPPVLPSLVPGAEAVLLVKPQFEAGREDVGSGGIVRDVAVHRRVLVDTWSFFAETELRPQALSTFYRREVTLTLEPGGEAHTFGITPRQATDSL